MLFRVILVDIPLRKPNPFVFKIIYYNSNEVYINLSFRFHAFIKMRAYPKIEYIYMWKVKSVFLIIINQNRKFTRIKSKILELYQKQIENYVGIWVDINITKVSVYTRYVLNSPRMRVFFSPTSHLTVAIFQCSQLSPRLSSSFWHQFSFI